MSQKIRIAGALLMLVVALGVIQAWLEKSAAAQGSGARVPTFQVDPFWPKLPDKVALGSAGVPGVAVDAQDHIWINQRYRTLSKRELMAAENPPLADCCIAGPPVMEFDQAGNYIQGWGGPGPGYEWPEHEHGIHVDYKGNVWVAGNGAGDGIVLKFTKNGKFLLQIGHSKQPKEARSLDTENFNQPAEIFVWPKTNELFVADGYINRRVAVYNADTGAFKRMWGAYGNKPDDSASREAVKEGSGPQQFNLVHHVRISNDGLVYVSDRRNNRVQLFTIEGKFIKEVFIARATREHTLGTAFSVAFSPDAKQEFLYVADAANSHIRILNRDSLQLLSSWGRYGRNAGHFIEAHSIATDSKGNLYVGESGGGGKIQRFTYKGMGAPTGTQ